MKGRAYDVTVAYKGTAEAALKRGDTKPRPAAILNCTKAGVLLYAYSGQRCL